MKKKTKRTVAPIITNKELKFQNKEKAKRAAELMIANKELKFQNKEKAKRAAELMIANKELKFQNKEKAKRAAELIMSNKELEFQNKEKAKRAAELMIANEELKFQNKEKAKRAAELMIANKELKFQNKEKAKRAAELMIANKELKFQNKEKAKRAAELMIANEELKFQNREKAKRAAELIMSNKELEFQIDANNTLEQYTYVVSHNLQEPLRTVSNYIQILEDDYSEILDGNARQHLHLIADSAKRMSTLLDSLADISRLGRNIKLTNVDCRKIIDDVIADLENIIKTSNAIIEIKEMPVLNVYEVEMRQLFQNLIANAIKFQTKGVQPKIQIRSEKAKGKWKFFVADNGIGIAPSHFKKIFDIFQRLHTDKKYEGSGIGLANCKKIVQLHQGEICVESNNGQGSIFSFTISNLAQ
ncbi:MAG: ATP-binding protein [Bacteroidia bacterium]